MDATTRRALQKPTTAPTLSWASTMYGVVTGYTHGEATTHHATIGEAVSSLKTASNFGQVADAYVVVDGYMLDAMLGMPVETRGSMVTSSNSIP